MVGIVTTAVLTSALGSVQIVRMELMQGNFERILISPMGPVWGVVAVAAFPIAYSTVFAGVMLALASLLFGVPLLVAGIAPALGVGILGALCLACIGLLFVGALIAFKSSLGATWVIAGLTLLGGAYFPLRLFPGWIRWTSDVQPYTPTVDLLRHLLIGTRPVEAVWIELRQARRVCRRADARGGRRAVAGGQGEPPPRHDHGILRSARSAPRARPAASPDSHAAAGPGAPRARATRGL